MRPETNCTTLTIQQMSGHLAVDRATVELGTYLQWSEPEDTTAEIGFVDASPFGSVKTLTQGQSLPTIESGVFPYRCSLRQGGVVIGSDSPEDGNWGGEVEVTGKGNGRSS